METHVLDSLERIAKRLPDKAAFCDDEVTLSFSQLENISGSIGSRLISSGLYKEPVLVFMKKSPRTIAAFFGVIRSGCFYVPIDEEMPRLRIDLIIETTQPRLLICDESTRAIAETLNFDGEICSFAEICDHPRDEEALQRVRAASIDTDPIYIVFTSGSTGRPKGVAACHRSVLDYVHQLSKVLGFGEETVFGNQTPLYFDACLKEVYPTLMFGATTWLIPHAYFSQPKRLVEYLNEKKINTICWVVSALTMISAFKTFDEVKPEYLRTIAFGSEVFPVRQYRIWKSTLPEAQFVNLYGPTEGTGMSCFYRCERDFAEDEPIPIGKPFPNTEVMLLKEDNTLAADGEEGEICLRGTCVTLGYYRNPEKTAEAFVQNPLNDAYPEIIYRTGDIARRDENGDLIFISRKDFQIKHMGHRIELGEIEANVNRVDGVKLCGCTYDLKKGKISCFYVGDIEPKELTKELKGMLPRYMLPNRTRQIAKMPFTSNGKIDRNRLKEM